MKNMLKLYLKELIILFLQLFMFYVFPLFSGPTDMMAVVLLIWISTIISGITIAFISNKKIKLYFPLIISLLFIPSVFIYYNESALIHTFWYLISSAIGLIIGIGLRKMIKTKTPV